MTGRIRRVERTGATGVEPKPVSTSYVRRIYSRAPLDSLHGGDPNPTPEHAAEQFDRWLAAHDQEVRAAVLEQVVGPRDVVHLFAGHMDGVTAVVDSGISLCCRTFAPKGLGTVIPGEETCGADS